MRYAACWGTPQRDDSCQPKGRLLAEMVSVIWMNAGVVLGVVMLPGYIEALVSQVRVGVPGYLGALLGCSVADRRGSPHASEAGPGTAVGSTG